MIDVLDVADAIEILERNFTSWRGKSGETSTAALAQDWAFTLGNCSREVLLKATYLLIGESEENAVHPKVGDLLARVNRIRLRDLPTLDRAWAEVVSECNRIHEEKPNCFVEFRDPVVYEVVRHAGGFRQFYLAREGIEFTRKRFEKSYGEYVRANVETLQLPAADRAEALLPVEKHGWQLAQGKAELDALPAAEKIARLEAAKADESEQAAAFGNGESQAFLKDLAGKLPASERKKELPPTLVEMPDESKARRSIKEEARRKAQVDALLRAKERKKGDQAG